MSAARGDALFWRQFARRKAPVQANGRKRWREPGTRTQIPRVSPTARTSKKVSDSRSFSDCPKISACPFVRLSASDLHSSSRASYEARATREPTPAMMAHTTVRPLPVHCSERKVRRVARRTSASLKYRHRRYAFFSLLPSASSLRADRAPRVRDADRAHATTPPRLSSLLCFSR